jgi:hypothetical protein
MVTAATETVYGVPFVRLEIVYDVAVLLVATVEVDPPLGVYFTE